MDRNGSAERSASPSPGSPSVDTAFGRSMDYANTSSSISELQAEPTVALTVSNEEHHQEHHKQLQQSPNIKPEDISITSDEDDLVKMLSEVLNDNEQQQPPPPMADGSSLRSNSAYISSNDDLLGSLSDQNNNNNKNTLADYQMDQMVGMPDIDPENSNLHDNTQNLDEFLQSRKQYFVLSMAGKPVYSLHGSDEITTSYMGVLQAIVSFFDEESGSELKSFRADGTLFVVSVQDPLILVAVDRLGQSEMQLKAQLDVLYAQILSTLTKSQIARAFKDRQSFDLRNLLGGTEVFLNALTKQMCYGSPAILLGALECLKLKKSLREKVNHVLVNHRSASLLYGLILAEGDRLVSVIRPKKHSLHPPDLSLLFSMLFRTTSFRDGGEHWVPICLPRFNSSGFLYAYIYFFVPDMALVLISPDKTAFFELRESAAKVLDELDKSGLKKSLSDAVQIGRFRTAEASAPLIRHFLYKSKANVQFIMPNMQPYYDSETAQHQLMVLYHQMHATMHSKGSQPAKVMCTARKSVVALAWSTPSFELYCVTGPSTKDAISSSVRTLVSWIKQQEQRLFIIGGAVF